MVLLNVLRNLKIASTLDLLLLVAPQITPIPITILALKLIAHYHGILSSKMFARNLGVVSLLYKLQLNYTISPKSLFIVYSYFQCHIDSP